MNLSFYCSNYLYQHSVYLILFETSNDLNSLANIAWFQLSYWSSTINYFMSCCYAYFLIYWYSNYSCHSVIALLISLIYWYTFYCRFGSSCTSWSCYSCRFAGMKKSGLLIVFWIFILRETNHHTDSLHYMLFTFSRYLYLKAHLLFILNFSWFILIVFAYPYSMMYFFDFIHSIIADKCFSFSWMTTISES